jgi:class 3 adenylate cyclase
MEPRIQYAQTSDGVSIAYWSIGSGPVLIWMPPFPFSHIGLEWELPERREFYERVAEGVTLVRYDGRGTGMSGEWSQEFTPEHHFRDIEAVADRMGLDRFALYAYLHMGPVAVAYSASHPDRVSHLAMFCTYARGQDYARSPQGGAISALIDADWQTYTEMAAHILSRWAPGDTGPRYASLIPQAATRDVTLNFMEAAERQDVTELLPETKCPALVMHRAGLLWPPLDVARELVARMPNARLALLSGNTAALHLEDTATTVKLIHGFLQEGQTSAPALPSGTATILFADIVDSTALTERLGDATFRDKARDLDTALRAIIRDSAGTPIEGKLLGDGVLATFTSARQAIEAALKCGVAGESAGLPLHLGLHAGDVIREADNVYGGAVNIAARISGLSAPGEVLVSDTVRSLARTSAGVTFEDRGEQALKGIDDPVRVWAVRQG